MFEIYHRLLEENLLLKKKKKQIKFKFKCFFYGLDAVYTSIAKTTINKNPSAVPAITK